MDLHNTMPQIEEFLTMAKESASGEVFIGGQSSGAIILKMNPADGSLYTNFGNNGILHHSFPFADMEIQADGKFLIGGSHPVTDYNAGFSITRLNSDGSLDLSFNGTGTFTADISPGNDYLQTLEVIAPDQILVGGSSPLSGSNSDFMLVKILSGGNLSVNESMQKEIAVYPNPFSDEVFFSIPEGELAEVKLVDAAGRTITTLKTGENKLSLGHLSKGIYQLVFTELTGETSFKSIVKH
ncbi:hypothetical protein D3C86_1335900 [compost metagenome]